MSEASLSKKIVAALNALPACHAEKRWTGGVFGRSGQPDVTGCIGGRHFEIEVKLPGERPTKIQNVWLGTWAEAGALTGVATSVDEALAIVGANSVA